MQAAYWSADGYDWTRTILTDREYLEGVAAYDDGYVAVSIPALDGAHLDTIWYSADGSTWSRMPLRLEEPLTGTPSSATGQVSLQ
jgi:hypothetical protein